MEKENGADKLITGILEEAREQASAIEWKSGETISAIKKKLEDDREAVRDEFTAKAQAARELTLKTARTNAELTGRKELLSRKRGLIDEAYSAAYERMCAFEGAKREELIKKLLQRECEPSAAVRPSKKDAELIAALLPGTGIEGLSLGEIDPDITDGFSVAGTNYYKNCSFAALMEEVRSFTETEVTKSLFD